MKIMGYRQSQHIVEYTEAVVCDICGNRHEGGSWTKDYYEVLETEVSHSSGTSYPSGGQKRITSFDICPNCFKEKLIPFIESFGAIPTINEVDW